MKTFLIFALFGSVSAVQVEVASRLTDKAQAVLRQASAQTSRFGKAEVALETAESIVSVVTAASDPSTFTNESGFVTVVSAIRELLESIVNDMEVAKKHNQVQLNKKWLEILKAHDQFEKKTTAAEEANATTMGDEYTLKCGVEDAESTRPDGPWTGGEYKIKKLESEVKDLCKEVPFTATPFDRDCGDACENLDSDVNTLGDLAAYLGTNHWVAQDVLLNSSSHALSVLNSALLTQSKVAVETALSLSTQCLTKTTELTDKANWCRNHKVRFETSTCALDAQRVLNCRSYSLHLKGTTDEYVSLVGASKIESENRANEAMIVDKVNCIVNALATFSTGRQNGASPYQLAQDLSAAVNLCQSRLIPMPFFTGNEDEGTYEGENWYKEGSITGHVTKLNVFGRPVPVECDCGYIDLCVSLGFEDTESKQTCLNNFAAVSDDWDDEIKTIAGSAPFTLDNIAPDWNETQVMAYLEVHS